MIYDTFSKHSRTWGFDLSQLGETVSNIVSLNPSVHMPHDDFHIFLERFTNIWPHIESDKLPIWWWGLGIYFDVRLFQMEWMFRGVY